jgi:hypothetical protein
LYVLQVAPQDEETLRNAIDRELSELVGKVFEVEGRVMVDSVLMDAVGRIVKTATGGLCEAVWVDLFTNELDVYVACGGAEFTIELEAVERVSVEVKGLRKVERKRHDLDWRAFDVE